MPTVETVDAVNEGVIFARLWERGNGGFSPELARHIVELRFSVEDVARMRDLAARNQAGLLTAAELRELDSYVKVGDLLAILQSKARKYLKARSR